MQTGLIHGTGMAFLGGEIRVVAPVLQGDTIRVEVEIVDKENEEARPRHRHVPTPRCSISVTRTLEARLQRMIRRSA